MVKGLLVGLTLLVSVLAADFSGTYEAKDGGDTVSLKLEQQGTTLTGTAKSGDGDLRLSGTVNGDEATGTVTVEGVPVKLSFKMKLTGDSLDVALAAGNDFSDADHIVFKRKPASPGPAKDETRQDPSAFRKEAVGVLKEGKEYTHASGGKLRYPSDWNLKEEESFLRLTPPDAKEGELVVVVAESAEGATDPGSAEVLSYLDGQVAEFMPDAKRDGKVEPCASGTGKGAVVSWIGSVEGRRVFVRAYVTIVKGHGVAVVALGPKEVVLARDKKLREILLSVGWGQGKVDNTLVGVWNHWGYSGTSDGKYGREEKVKVELRADGSFTYQNDSETNISGGGTDQGGNSTWVGGMSSRRGNGWNGTWTADGTVVTLTFEDGTSESFRYRFEQQGQNTFLVTEPANGGKGKMEWSRAGL
ncbi:MAG: lipocalin family protein [Armatimonadetes bacterium]|nr:lipocalin family protein [Armatimonadota bacterium]